MGKGTIGGLSGHLIQGLGHEAKVRDLLIEESHQAKKERIWFVMDRGYIFCRLEMMDRDSRLK